MKEIGDDTKRRNKIPCSWIGRMNVVKMTVLPNPQIQCAPIKLSVAFFTEIEQKILKFIWKHKRPK